MKSLTPAVARALEVARFEALAGSSPEVLPEHVLHGLLEEEEGRASTLLAAAGLRLADYRSELVKQSAREGEAPAEPGRQGTWAGEAPAEPGAQGSAGASPSRFFHSRSGEETLSSIGADQVPALPLADRTHEALRLARELAVDLTGESTLSSEPLLLALLRTDARTRASLEDLGLRFDVLESSLEQQKPPAPRLEEPLNLVDPVETMDVARILDVGANRTREALRIIEDYCRFVLEDAFLTGELKRLRHELSESIQELGPPRLLQARETLLDVGTTISTESERSRSSLGDVVQVNLKRLQEALRSLEEFAKVTSPRLGERLEQFRYRAYTLERAVLACAAARQGLNQVQLYALLSGATCVAGLEWTINQAALGGVSMVQLREKTLCDRDLLQRAREVRRWSRQAGVLFIVNDRPDIARLVEADGVHLGQDDLPVKEARRILGPESIIGVSTHNIEQVRRAVLEGAGYIGVGPTFPSGTKSFDDFPGLAFVESALSETTLPAFAIGGINSKTIESVVRSGSRRVAVSQAIAGSDDPRSTAAALLSMLPPLR